MQNWIRTSKAEVMEDKWRFVCRHGYQVYDPYMGDSFTTKHERNNQSDNNVTLAITHAFTQPVHERRSYYLGTV